MRPKGETITTATHHYQTPLTGQHTLVVVKHEGRGITSSVTALEKRERERERVGFGEDEAEQWAEY